LFKVTSRSCAPTAAEAAISSAAISPRVGARTGRFTLGTLDTAGKVRFSRGP